MLIDLVKQAGWRRWTAAGFLSRLPLTMGILALVLAGEEALDSPAQGAVLAGILTFTAGLLGPWAGRRFDRREMRGALQVNCLVASVVVLLLAGLVHYEPSFAVLAGGVVLLGVVLAGMVAGFRALLLVAVAETNRGHAHFVESLMVEVGYGIGPLIVTATYITAGLEAVLLVMAASFVLAAVVLRGVPRMLATATAVAAPRRRTSRLLRRACGLAFLVALGVGLVEGSVALRMSEIGLSTSAAGPFLVLLSIGSCIGGLYVSFRRVSTTRVRLKVGLLLAVFALTLLPYALADSKLAFLLLLPVASIPLVPLNGLASALVESEAGEVKRGESFALFLTSMTVGGGVGVSLAGVLADVLAPAAPTITASCLYGLLAIGLVLTHSLRPGRRAARPGPAPGKVPAREPFPPEILAVTKNNRSNRSGSR